MLFMGLHYRAELTMNKHIEQRTYGMENTITLKIPVTLPYQIFAEDFQYIQGEFEHNGTFYNLIKQKVANDTLYVVCIENELKSGIETRKVDFEKATNDWPGTTKTTYNLFTNFSKDFLQNSSWKPVLSNPVVFELSYARNTFETLDGFHNTSKPPPKYIV